MKTNFYIAVDLRSFYASVECVDRALDPLNTNLVVADNERTDKTICLAVTPTLKDLGVGSRPRLFEVIQRINYLNQKRNAINSRASYFFNEIKADPNIKIDYLIAKPRMARYLEISTEIFGIYLDWVAPEDIHVYSIDEVFIDITKYLRLYNMYPIEIAKEISLDILKRTGISSTAGVGTNLYLSKIAMDILAKKKKEDANGTKVAFLDEELYKKLLWNHRPITDFWQIGSGYKRRLAKYNLYTMGDIARLSLTDEDLLFLEFGINAELLIDHAWGVESCTMADIKAYKPKSRSVSNGQVLLRPYKVNEARIVILEMAYNLALELVRKKVITDRLSLRISYDRESLSKNKNYKGPLTTDSYGRLKPKSVRATRLLNNHTASSNIIAENILNAFDEIVNEDLLVRKLNITAGNILNEDYINPIQLNLLDDSLNHIQDESEKILQEIVVSIKEKYGKNSIIRGVNLLEEATGIMRNKQIGGHNA